MEAQAAKLQERRLRERPRPGPKPKSDAHLQRVARIYRAAIERGTRAPREAIVDEFTVAYSTASKWIRDARRRGFLGPAIAPGTAGEAESAAGGEG
jgi:hypothetical protein